ncbi:UNVERIFIED_CONTAM: phosphatidylinositol-4- kinase [Siphonaria sp. JEL0065]|nr:phosphatidylinositol-4- kinase [Siphonaria sp. JEL0065]
MGLRQLSFSLNSIVSEAAKTAAALSKLEKDEKNSESQLFLLCLGSLVNVEYDVFIGQVRAGERSLAYSDQQGLVATLDYYLAAKTKENVTASPVVQFCLSLVKDLPETGKLLASGSIESEFCAFVNNLVKKLLLIGSASERGKDGVLKVVWESTERFVSLLPGDKTTVAIAHSVFGAIVQSPAQLHRSFTSNLISAIMLAFSKLVFKESSAITDSATLIQETASTTAELFGLAFHNLSGYFLSKTASHNDSQLVWDTLLESKSDPQGSPPKAELVKFFTSALKAWTHLSLYFASDYDIVSPILPFLLKSLALCGVSGVGTTEVFGKVKEFLENVTAEHLEYDPSRTEIAVVTVESLAFIGFNTPGLIVEAIDFLIRFIVNPRIFNGNTHVHIVVLRNCAISMLKKSLVILGSPAISKSTLFTFINTMQSSSTQGSVAIHESCVAAISGVIPAISRNQTVEVAIPAIIRRIEGGDIGNPQVRGMWESLEIAGLTGDLQVFTEIYPILAISILKGDRLKFQSALAAKAAHPLAFLEKLLETFVERVSMLDVTNDKGLFNIATVMKSLSDIPTFHPEIGATPELILLFRNFWITITTFIFAPRSIWPKEWIAIVTSISAKTPTLALGAGTRSLEVDLVSNSVLRLKISDSVYSKVKSSLVSALFSRASETKSIGNPVSAFLLSILQIELFRAGKGSLSFLLEYIREERYYETEVFNLLQAIGEEVLFAYTKGKSIGKVSIQHTFKALLKCGANRLPKVRSFAQGCCVRLLNAVPALLWDKGLICYMLDIVLYLDSKRLVLDERLAVLKSKLNFELHFVDDIEQTQAAKDYRQLCANMLNLALGHSLSETTLTLQGYLLDLQINYPDLLGDRSDVISLLSQFCSREEVANDVIKSLNARAKYIGEVRGVVNVLKQFKLSDKTASDLFKDEIRNLPTKKGVHMFIKELSPVLQRCAAFIVSESKVDEELVRLVCWTPLTIFNISSIETALPVWNYIMSARPDLNARMLYELTAVWESTIYNKKGLYANSTKSADPFHNKMTYTPSKKPEAVQEPLLVHCRWIQFLSSRFRSTLWYKKEHAKIYGKFIQAAVSKLNLTKLTPGLRKTVFSFLELAILSTNELESQSDPHWLFSLESLFTLAFKWYSLTPMWSNYQEGELKILSGVRAAFKNLNIEKANSLVSTLPDRLFSHFKPFKRDLTDVKNLVLLLLDNELSRYGLWAGGEKGGDSFVSAKDIKWGHFVKVAWFVHPAIALNLPRRFMGSTEVIEAELAPLILQHTLVSIHNSNAITPLLNANLERFANEQRFLLYWSEVSPISAISYLSPQYNHPWILQYAFRVLEYHPVEQVFFYIPQMVQALRNDVAGYVEHFILKTAKTSQLFAHQIIWNMNANMFIVVKVKKHEERLDPDPIKPTLDKIIKKITSSLSGEDREFYEREFKFFAEVTGISGKLKPYIQKSKAEKKKKIDEEMRNIKVEVGVYLPSNPESIVLDIDVDSGRPLQSHAKAPFMATFKVKKDDEEGSETAWQSSIFKVGDDCRQDVLALQLISIFKNIVERSGLDVYLYPYRVVATDCGCGVIEVIPHSISRDMMGREKVNSLPNYFAEKYGSKDSFQFKKAQEAFVRSLAAYSVVLYLISIKDRHNGNIMFDDLGHTVHIDFGFILDIAPGGIEFEASPFKLTTEFIELMGGDASYAYKLFSDLVVKTFLSLRPYAEEIIQMVALMLESGLPCFKGEATIKKLRSKFQLELDDKKAAEFMLQQIQKSHENKFSRLYDRFQNIQNGIPF